MVVGPSGISLRDSERRAFNVLWPEVAVGVRWDDGSRLLVGRDGTQILFRPRLWRDPHLLLAAIDGNTPADRIIQAEGESPSAGLPMPPKPARTGSAIARFRSMMLVGTGVLLIAIAVVAYVKFGGHR